MERYWKRWESFARQQCFNRFIPLESHEVLMDAIMTLLRQPESKISDLIRTEKTGRPVILHWVYRAVIIHVKRHRVECLKVDPDYNLEALISAPAYEEDEVFDGFLAPCGTRRHICVKIVFYGPAHSATPDEVISADM